MPDSNAQADGELDKSRGAVEHTGTTPESRQPKKLPL